MSDERLPQGWTGEARVWRVEVSDLDQAREAVELFDEHGFDWKEARNRYKHTIAAARRFLALTETGQRVEWCEVHRVVPGPWHRGNVEEGGEPCRIIPAYVIPADYLTEEDR